MEEKLREDAGATNIVGLECSACGKKYDAAVEQHLCTCGKPLLARYDLREAAKTLTLEALKSRPRTLWRYAEVLPDDPPVSLGEGMTPLVHAKRLGAAMRCGTGFLAYAAAAGIPAVIVMPADTPSANVMECQAFGAKVVKLNGLISDCGKYVAEHKDREGWYDVSTLKEPYRVEGKKTMGYELWEQFGGKLPDVIFYPTGGGVGLIGMCKAFDEMQEMGWIGGERPRMVAVQAEGCAPIVKAWEAHQNSAQFFENAATIASGLRVPGPLGDQLILSMLRQTKGTAIAVSDDEMLQAGRELAWKIEIQKSRTTRFSQGLGDFGLGAPCRRDGFTTTMRSRRSLVRGLFIAKCCLRI